MPKAIFTKPTALYAASLCVHTETTRYSLCGVQIEPGPGGVGALIVATNGHIMSCAYDIDASLTDWPATGFILPIHKLQAGLLAKATTVDVTWQDNMLSMTTKQGLVITDCTPIDGSYPDWKRIIPSSTDGVARPLAAKYLTILAKIAAAVAYLPGKSNLVIQHNGERVALISVDGVDWWQGFLMSVRSDKPVPNKPAWITAT